MVDTFITEKQFKRYQKVQLMGNYNMFSPEAMEVAGLNREQFLEIMKNYDKLEEKYGKSE